MKNLLGTLKKTWSNPLSPRKWGEDSVDLPLSPPCGERDGVRGNLKI
jgi:hypothetical protein